MSNLPETLCLNAVLAHTATTQQVFDHATMHFAARDDAGVTRWLLTSDLVAKRSLDKAMMKGTPVADDFARLGPEAFDMGFAFYGRHFVLAAKPMEDGTRGRPSETFGIGKGWSYSLTCRDLEGVDAGGFRSMMDLLQESLRGLCATLPLLRAEIRRESETFIGPFPPLANPEVVTACLSTDLVPAEYADPDGFWSAWDRVDYLGEGHALVQRGADLVEETAFKAVALRSGLAMGRAAKPGKTTYFLPDPSGPEQALLDAEESCLEQVGYNAQAHSLEFTAMLPEGMHLPARDLFLLVQYLENGAGGGEPVDLVIVTFPTRAMAEAEARPLRDIGARVQYLSDSGEWQVLED
ncbi:MAG: hypothetical protein ACK4RN_03640 [Pseudorhodobacter sp.]